MKSVNRKLIVSVNMDQKSTMDIGGVAFSIAQSFQTNYRERSPVMAKVEEGNEIFRRGDIIICHHNHFYDPSPYHLQDNLFSIPQAKTIFTKVLSNGDLIPLFGNVIGELVEKIYPIEVPIELREKYKDRIRIAHAGWTNFKKDDIVFTRPAAPYEIVYNFNGVEKRVIKVDSEMICGVVKF